jgi:asparagine synthetase B (glutamine-hydrolysing)
VAVWDGQRLDVTPYFTRTEQLDSALHDQREAVHYIRQHCREAITRRLAGKAEIGLYLSGGLDSLGVALWLKQAGVSRKSKRRPSPSSCSYR